MFSLQKLAVFAVILVALWLAFRVVRNLERQHRERERLARPRRRGWFRFGRTRAGGVDLLECPVCGHWIAADRRRACGRDDCPRALDPRTSAP